MSNTDSSGQDKPERRPSPFGIAGLVIGAVSLVLAIVPASMEEAEERDRNAVPSPPEITVTTTGPALSERAADFLVETGEHVADKVADKIKNRLFGSDEERATPDTQPASHDGSAFAADSDRSRPNPDHENSEPASELAEESSAKPQRSWAGMLHIGATGGGVLAALLAASSWIRREDLRISLVAAILGVLALAWQYIVMGIVIGVALAVLAAIGGAWG